MAAPLGQTMGPFRETEEGKEDQRLGQVGAKDDPAPNSNETLISF